MARGSRIGRFFGFGKTSQRRRTVEKIGRARERADAPRPVARREGVIGVLCGLNLMFLPWATAGYTLWSQVVSAGLALAAFAFLFLPVGYDERRSAMARESLAALVRCVPFWCGLALMALFLTQGLNPAYTVMFDGGTWLVMPETPVPGLPAGVDAPFDRDEVPGGMNAFRTALMFLSPWLTFCALWCGISARRIVLRLGIAVALSASALAVFALVMRASGRSAPLGFLPADGASAFGSFFYQNQAGAFFALTALTTSSLVATYWMRAAAAGRRGGAHLPLLIAVLLTAAAALASFSFGALAEVALGVPVVVASAVVCRRRLAQADADAGSDSSLQGRAVAALVAAAVIAVAVFADYRGLADKVSAKFGLMRREALDDRAPIRAATLRMYGDTSPVWGYGAGSYRWVSPTYFARDAAFCDAAGVLNRRASHAHGDGFQMLAEWGAFGLAAVAIAIGWVMVRLRHVFSRTASVAWPAFAALVLLLAHSGAECLLFNPAIALTAVFAVFFVRRLIHAAIP